MESAHKVPGRSRTTWANGTVVITDARQKKSLTIIPEQRQYIEKELSATPAENADIDIFEQIKALPSLADEVLGERIMDGRTVRGFRVIKDGMDLTLWVDVKTEDVFRMEGTHTHAPAIQIVVTDFRFDVDLDDSLFSLTPPEGYSPLQVQVFMPREEHLVHLLRGWATRAKDGLFPPSLNTAEVAKAGLEMKEARKSVVGDKGQETEEQRLQRLVWAANGSLFVARMKPENDWHYAGKGVKLGTAEKPICWWKPEGSKTYRVIYGDLSIKDVKGEVVPLP